MSQPNTDPRPASSAADGLVRTGIGAAGVATLLIGLTPLTGPLLGVAIVASTAVLSATGKTARNYDYATPPEKRVWWKSWLATAFSWLG